MASKWCLGSLFSSIDAGLLLVCCRVVREGSSRVQGKVGRGMKGRNHSVMLTWRGRKGKRKKRKRNSEKKRGHESGNKGNDPDEERRRRKKKKQYG